MRILPLIEYFFFLREAVCVLIWVSWLQSAVKTISLELTYAILELEDLQLKRIVFDLLSEFEVNFALPPHHLLQTRGLQGYLGLILADFALDFLDFLAGSTSLEHSLDPAVFCVSP